MNIKKNTKKMCCIILSTIILCSGFMSNQCFADTDDYCSGTWSDPTNIRVQWFNSAYTYCSAFTSCPNWWNGISNNLKITTIRSNTDDDAGYEIRIYGSSIISSAATTQNYVKVLGVPIPTWSGSWAYSIVTINTTEFSSASTSLKKKIIVHEVGHSLGLDHPAPDSSHTSINAIMKQGDNGYYTIQTHDMDNIKAKYN